MTADGYITLSEAATLIPGQPSRAKVARWAASGLRVCGERVSLQSIRVGARILTRSEWVAAFVARLNAEDLRPQSPKRRGRRPTERRKARRPRMVRYATTRAELKRQRVL